MAAAISSAVTLPWKGTADSFAHMDYVYQVQHGQLPGPRGYKYAQETPDNSRQWASAHPPLFYWLASFPMGEPLDRGEWELAVARGRMLNILIGLASVFALAWAGWQLGGDRRASMAIALPAIAGLLPTFIRFSGEIYNDPLAVLFSILCMTISCLILRDGLRHKYLIPLALVCALGMASRATFIFAFLLALVAVFIASVKGQPGTAAFRLFRGGAASALLAVTAILPIAWFYQRNHQLSGSWFRSSAKHGLQDRAERTLEAVLTDDRFWLLVPKGLLGPKWRSTWPINDNLSFWLCAICATVIALLIIYNKPWRQAALLDRKVLIWLLITAHFAGLMLAQLQHATGWGSLNFRYFLPTLLSIGLFLTVPTLAWTRLSTVLVPLLSGLLAVSGLLGTITYLDSRYASIARGDGSWARLIAAVEGNGLGAGWIWIPVILMATSLAVITVATFHTRVLMPSRTSKLGGRTT